MPPRKDLICFVDLETTGNEAIDEIIEVGVSMWAWPEWKEVYAKDLVVVPSGAGLARLEANPVVLEMHQKNGLYGEILGYAATEPEHFRVALADDLLDDDLLDFGSRGSSHIPLAGSGVLHFDRKYMIRDLPKFNSRLSYWAYDVGVMRRMFQLAGAQTLEDGGKTHRALDDARLHADEFRFYFDRIERMYGQLKTEANVIID